MSFASEYDEQQQQFGLTITSADPAVSGYDNNASNADHRSTAGSGYDNSGSAHVALWKTITNADRRFTAASGWIIWVTHGYVLNQPFLGYDKNTVVRPF